MIRFICPDCDKRLAVGDDKAGKVAVCPGCQTRIQIPEADPPAEAVTAEPPLRRRPTSDEASPAAPLRRRRPSADEDDAPPPRPRPRRPDPADDDDDIPEAEVARPRKRKKKKRSRSRSGSGVELPFGIDPFFAVLVGVVLLVLPVAALALVFGPLSYGVIAVGLIMGIAGRIWFLSVAFQDDSTQALLCRWVPLYSIVYLISNFDEAKRPFFLELTGGVIAALGFIVMGISGL